MNKNCVILDKILDVPLENEIGSFFVGAYKILNRQDLIEEVIILYCGELSSIKNVRINSACYTGDLFHCNRCDCNIQMMSSIKLFCSENNGLLIYLLNQDGRGCGTVNKLKSLLLMDQDDLSTKEAFEKLGLEPDKRDYSASVTVLKDLGIDKINLVTNNPEKVEILNANGIKILKRIPSITEKPELIKYLKSKQHDFHHLMEL